MKEYDLEKRTLLFSKKLITFCNSCKNGIVVTPLISQLIRSGTSIGANYHEANGASSKKDFQNKIFICKKESKETLYWLQLLGDIVKDENIKQDYQNLLQEAKELMLIFGKISQSAKN